MPRPALMALSMTVLVLAAGAAAATSAGDAKRGAQLFRVCAACHSLVPGRNMTGPSLAGVWGRKAAGLDSFERYSQALKASTIVWEAETLDQWLEAPARLIPQNRMIFAGIPEPKARADLIAYLNEASAGHAPSGATGQSGGGMGGMGAATSGFQDLKKLGPEHQVQTIRYCRDTYHLTTADGQTVDFWEANLRFKTDSSDVGPLAGEPVILGAGMTGDRASVFFAAPEEISAFIKHQC